MFVRFGETGKKRCRTLLFLTVLIFFFLLPLHSDPTLSIILGVVLGLFASDGFSASSNLTRYALIAFLGYALIAFAASVHSLETLTKYPIVALWGGALFVGMCFGRLFPGHQYPFFLATALGILLSLGIAAAQGLDAPPFWQGARLKLLAVHPSRLALYCAITLLFCLHRAVVAPRGNRKALFLVLAAALACCLYLTNTRSVILNVPLGVLCLIPAIPQPCRKPFLAVFLAVCALGATYLWSAKDTPLNTRLVSMLTNPVNDPTFRSRIPIWEAAWESFKDAPLLGHGVKSYSRLHGEYLAAHKTEWDEKYAGSYDPRAKNAHSIILGRLVESGIPGTACFLLFYAAVTLAAFMLPPPQRWIAAIFVFYMGIGIFDDTLFRRNDIFIFLLAGTVLGFSPEPTGPSHVQE